MILALLGAALAAPAELRQTHQVAVAGFPTGLQYIYEAEVSFPLWNSDNVLLRDANVALIAHAELTPSFPRMGPALRISPIAVWDVTLRAWSTWYFGTFSSILPLDGPDFEATAAAKRELAAEGERRSGWGVRLDAETRFKGRAGPMIAMLELQYRHQSVQVAGEDLVWFWDPTEMLEVAADGEVFNRNLFVFYEARRPRAATADDPGDDSKLWIGAVGFWQTSVQ